VVNQKSVVGGQAAEAASLVPPGEDWEAEARSDYKPCYDPKVKLEQGNIM